MTSAKKIKINGLDGYQCGTCKHAWVPRNGVPKKCPRCQAKLGGSK